MARASPRRHTRCRSPGVTDRGVVSALKIAWLKLTNNLVRWKILNEKAKFIMMILVIIGKIIFIIMLVYGILAYPGAVEIVMKGILRNIP